jgi:three-Cys-motif partner protein
MSTGTTSDYWKARKLPSVLKHALLNQYIPVFCGKTGSTAGSVVYLDGYAGAGRYENGEPGSAEMVLKQALKLKRPFGIDYTIFLFEKDASSYRTLEKVATEYQNLGVGVHAKNCDVEDGLDEVLTAARGKPLFLFLDPCGLGLPFNILTGCLRRKRTNQEWQPTEVLLNFSLDAVRRIGGTVLSDKKIPEATPARLDETLGGTWWRQIAEDSAKTKSLRAQAIADGFCKRLSRETAMFVQSVPVRRQPNNEPVYNLVFGTKKPIGLWHFSDATARATEKWWDTVEDIDVGGEPGSQMGFFPRTADIRPVLKTVEQDAMPVIAENIADLLKEVGEFVVGEHPSRVLGEYFGRVRETTVRAAVKSLHAQGRTSSDGKGDKIAKLVVSPPTSP